MTVKLKIPHKGPAERRVLFVFRNPSHTLKNTVFPYEVLVHVISGKFKKALDNSITFEYNENRRGGNTLASNILL